MNRLEWRKGIERQQYKYILEWHEDNGKYLKTDLDSTNYYTEWDKFHCVVYEIKDKRRGGAGYAIYKTSSDEWSIMNGVCDNIAEAQHECERAFFNPKLHKGLRAVENRLLLGKNI